MGKLSTALNAVGFKVKKYSPELLIVAAGLGTCAAIVLACKATTKAEEILEEHKKAIDQIHEVKDNEEFVEQYTDDNYKKDLTIVYSNTVVKFIKLYGPTILTAAGALFCMFAAVNILRKRNAALTVACATLADAFSSYRQRVRDRYGDEVEFEIANDIHEIEEKTGEFDKKGNEKVKKTKVPSGVANPFAIVFDSSNPNWSGDREVDFCFIKSIQTYATDRLRSRKFLTINQIREEFGLDWIEEGQVLGWVYKKDNPVGDNIVDFHIMDDSKNFLDFMSGKNDFIILELNCDGYILDQFPSCDGSRKRKL